MQERSEDLAALQGLLDRSHAAAGAGGGDGVRGRTSVHGPGRLLPVPRSVPRRYRSGCAPCRPPTPSSRIACSLRTWARTPKRG